MGVSLNHMVLEGKAGVTGRKPSWLKMKMPGGSEYLKIVHGLIRGAPPHLDLDRERVLIALLSRAAAAGLLQSAHDCSDGGLAVTLAECAFDTNGIGLDVTVTDASGNPPATLFGESASRAVVSVAAPNVSALLKIAAELGVPALRIGRTGGSRIVINVSGGSGIDCSVAEAERIWSNALGQYFAGQAA